MISPWEKIFFLHLIFKYHWPISFLEFDSEWFPKFFVGAFFPEQLEDQIEAKFDFKYNLFATFLKIPWWLPYT